MSRGAQASGTRPNGIPPPSDDLIGKDCREAAKAASALFSSPQKFTERIEELIHEGEIVTDEKLFLADERVVERDYIPISLAGTSLGHLWLYFPKINAR